MLVINIFSLAFFKFYINIPRDLTIMTFRTVFCGNMREFLIATIIQISDNIKIIMDDSQNKKLFVNFILNKNKVPQYVV